MSNSRGKLGLMDINSDCRQLILQTLLVLPHPIELGPTNWPNEPPRGIGKDIYYYQIQPLLSIMRVSKTLHAEAQEIFYGQNKFRFSDPDGWLRLHQLVNKIKRSNASHLRYITLPAPWTSCAERGYTSSTGGRPPDSGLGYTFAVTYDFGAWPKFTERLPGLAKSIFTLLRLKNLRQLEIFVDMKWMMKDPSMPLMDHEELRSFENGRFATNGLAQSLWHEKDFWKWGLWSAFVEIMRQRVDSKPTSVVFTVIPNDHKVVGWFGGSKEAAEQQHALLLNQPVAEIDDDNITLQMTPFEQYARNLGITIRRTTWDEYNFSLNYHMFNPEAYFNFYISSQPGKIRYTSN